MYRQEVEVFIHLDADDSGLIADDEMFEELVDQELVSSSNKAALARFRNELRVSDGGGFTVRSDNRTVPH